MIFKRFRPLIRITRSPFYYLRRGVGGGGRDVIVLYPAEISSVRTRDKDECAETRLRRGRDLRQLH